MVTGTEMEAMLMFNVALNPSAVPRDNTGHGKCVERLNNSESLVGYNYSQKQEKLHLQVDYEKNFLLLEGCSIIVKSQR